MPESTINRSIKISEYFNLNKTQAELDFVDVFILKDLPLFIDPWAVRQWSDGFSNVCYNQISSYFECLIWLVRANKKEEALDLLSWLHEPKETHLGKAKDSFDGSWISDWFANEIYEKLKDSQAVATWFLKDLEDTALMIDGIAEDKISDMVTNIIRYQLIKYTQEQCKMHNIPMRPNTPTGIFWNPEEMDWISNREDMLIVEWGAMLLVPKFIVRKTLTIDAYEYFNIDILEFEQARHLDMSSSLCKTLKKWWLRAPAKNALKEILPKDIKSFIYTFSKENIKVFEDYKKKKSQFFKPLENQEIDESIDMNEIIDRKITELWTINSGNTDATRYEEFIKSALEILFYPDLTGSRLHDRKNYGRKIIDITFQNRAWIWFFWDLPKIAIPCKEIFFECKNYSDDPANPEFDQLNWRFSNHLSQVWFLICRKIENRVLFINRCKDFVLQKRHYIFWLEDSDIIQLLEFKKSNSISEINEFLESRLNEIHN